ncbi:MAG: shikimate kinase [Candidatus Shikimatogenerans bostrichidophilus]|nr:MAG: shikimate kinase [Candidatus Shikimatogenerans bostrichidophilus]
MKTILIGYMGCGKSYIGYILSLLTNNTFFDLDFIINKIYKIDTNQIFKKYGEYKFRFIEKKILNFFLKETYKKSYILSVGGGTPCYFNNISFMNNYVNTIFIKLSFKILYKRLLKDNNNRPILNIMNRRRRYKLLNRHYNKRISFYKRSKYIIKIKKSSFFKIAYYIKKKFNL